MSEKESSKEKVYDPGWNDPPVFSYDAHQAQLQTAKRSHLTKRVVFPIENKGETKEKTEYVHQLLPNIPVPTKSTEPFDQEVVSDTQKEFDMVPEEITLFSVTENFDIAIGEVYKESEKQGAEVKRRLQIMEGMWKEEKLNSSIKEKIFKLSEAIKDGDLDGADSFQRGLMVDFPSLCSSWMSGIRNLINKKRFLTTQA